MRPAPRISVIIPCRDMGRFVGQAVESVLAQTFPAHEVVVIDDGSADDTRSVLNEHTGRIRVLDGPGKGSAIARNLGILSSAGDHIAFLDADDLWMPAKLERQIELLTEKCGFVFADYFRGEDPSDPGEPVLPGYTALAEGSVFSNLLRENFVHTSSVLVRKDTLARTGIFKPHLIGGQDADLWLRLARVTQFRCVREPLVFARRHGGNITASEAYPYFHARKWQEVLREHDTSDPVDRSYIRYRYGLSLYDAGRHAIRATDQRMARHHLARAFWRGPHRLRAAAWLAVASLPSGLTSLLLRGKRSVAKGRRESPVSERLQGA